MFYSMHPEFLNFSLDYSLSKLGLQTLDAVLLTQPFEVAYHTKELRYASLERQLNHYYDKLAKAFEFYESAVQDGRIRSYGITAFDSLIINQEVMRQKFKKGYKVPNMKKRGRRYIAYATNDNPWP